MSNCPACHLAVPNVAGCCRTQLHILGEPIGVVPVAATGPGAACPGCGVAAGGLHHVSCPVAPCPLCVSPLAGCSCPFDERPPPAAGSVALPGAHGRRCQPYSLDDPPWQRELIESFPAACAPWRVRYRPLLRPLVRWAVERGRPVDLDMAALTFHVLEAQWRDWGVEMFLDRPDVTGILQYRAWGALATRGRASLPLDAAVHVWSVVAFLAESGRLSIDSDPLAKLAEPLRCYGGLGTDGYLRPEGEPSGVTCRCFDAVSALERDELVDGSAAAPARPTGERSCVG